VRRTRPKPELRPAELKELIEGVLVMRVKRYRPLAESAAPAASPCGELGQDHHRQARVALSGPKWEPTVIFGDTPGQ
jgi:hypothetical protein